MKILAFTDLHLSSTALKSLMLKSKLYGPDLLVCAGDFTIFENGITLILEKLSKFKKKILLVHGNHETDTVVKKICRQHDNLIFIHKKHYIHNNHMFFGYGGGGFALIEPHFYKTGETFSKIIKKNKDKKIIFITHAPPFGTKLDLIVDQHCGNKTFTHFIKKNKIDVHICGHLHENFGKKDRIKDTLIVNPGPYGKMIKI